MSFQKFGLKSFLRFFRQYPPGFVDAVNTVGMGIYVDFHSKDVYCKAANVIFFLLETHPGLNIPSGRYATREESACRLILIAGLYPDAFPDWPLDRVVGILVLRHGTGFINRLSQYMFDDQFQPDHLQVLLRYGFCLSDGKNTDWDVIFNLSENPHVFPPVLEILESSPQCLLEPLPFMVPGENVGGRLVGDGRSRSVIETVTRLVPPDLLVTHSRYWHVDNHWPKNREEWQESERICLTMSVLQRAVWEILEGVRRQVTGNHGFCDFSQGKWKISLLLGNGADPERAAHGLSSPLGMVEAFVQEFAHEIPFSNPVFQVVLDILQDLQCLQVKRTLSRHADTLPATIMPPKRL
jgi:hypothetical protein